MGLLTGTAVGRLGNDPEMRYPQQGQSVTNFNLAVNTNKDEVTWVRATAWGGRGEVINKWFSKGDEIAVSGELKMDEYTTSNGEPRQTLNMNVQTFSFMSNNNSKSNNDDGGYGSDYAGDDEEDEDVDDLPWQYPLGVDA